MHSSYQRMSKKTIVLVALAAVALAYVAKR